MTAVPRRRTPLAAAAALGLAVLLAACGSASEPYPPTGIDGLVIPTPEPDPDDFVDIVDNRWLPLAPGATWDYRVAGAGRVVEVRLEAIEGTERDGITTTVLQRTDLDSRGREVDRAADHLAQDRDGNVWWFGRDEVWFDEPGLIMPAAPRDGDGFLMAALPEGEVTAQVASTAGAVLVPAGRYDDLVTLEVTGLEGAVLQLSFAAGVGLVQNRAADGASEWELVAHDQPPLAGDTG